MIFADRRQAGQQLASELLRFRDQHPVVLALPRGGVTVGYEVAQALNAPLDVVLVRKIGAPRQPELAIGAVVDGEQPEIVLNPDIVRTLHIEQGFIDREAARQLAEIERRRKLYFETATRIDLAGKTVIVVDDGIATGATARAAVGAIRRSHPARLVLAVPVAPPDTVDELRADVDELICLHTPGDFRAIGYFYADFRQVSDTEVVDMLRAGLDKEDRRQPTAAPGTLDEV